MVLLHPSKDLQRAFLTTPFKQLTVEINDDPNSVPLVDGVGIRQLHDLLELRQRREVCRKWACRLAVRKQDLFLAKRV